MTEESQQFAIPDGEQAIDGSAQLRASMRFVTFRFEALENRAASDRAGQSVFDRALVVRTYYPGTRDYHDRVVLRWPGGAEPYVVDDEPLWRIVREHAERWMARQDEGANGTPLALLNLDVVNIAALRAAGVGSIEMLAHIPDSGLRVLPNMFDLRRRARAFLEARDSAAPLAKAEAEARNAREENVALRQQIDELTRELAALRAKAEAEPPASPSSPRRTRNA